MKSISRNDQIHYSFFLVIFAVLIYLFRFFPDLITADFVSAEYHEWAQDYLVFIRIGSLALHFANAVLIYQLIKKLVPENEFVQRAVSLIYFCHPLMYETFLIPSSILSTAGVTIFLTNAYIFLSGNTKLYKWALIPLTLIAFFLNQSLVFAPLIFIFLTPKEKRAEFKLYSFFFLAFAVLGYFFSMKYRIAANFKEELMYVSSNLNLIFESAIYPINSSYLNFYFLNQVTAWYFVEFFLFLVLPIYYFYTRRERMVVKFTAALFFTGVLSLLVTPWSQDFYHKLNLAIFRPSFYSLLFLAAILLLILLIDEMKKNYLKKFIVTASIITSLFFGYKWITYWESNSLLFNYSIGFLDFKFTRDPNLLDEVLVSTFESYIVENRTAEAENFLRDLGQGTGYIKAPEYLWIRLYATQKNVMKLVDYEKSLYTKGITNPVLMLAFGEGYKAIGYPRYRYWFDKAFETYKRFGELEKAKAVEDKYLK